jgi:hypothetical protein
LRTVVCKRPISSAGIAVSGRSAEAPDAPDGPLCRSQKGKTMIAVTFAAPCIDRVHRVTS